MKPPDEFAKRFIRKVKRIFRVPIQDLQRTQFGLDTGNNNNNNGGGARSFDMGLSQRMRSYNGGLSGYSHQVIEEDIDENRVSAAGAAEDDDPYFHQQQRGAIKPQKHYQEDADDDDDEGSYHPKYE